jgi:zinc protease
MTRRKNGMRTGYILSTLLGVLCMTSTPAIARQYDYRETTLENGLRVITLEDFSTPIAAVQVWYHVGSKNERPDRQGFAHMFEHMMFRGTDLLGPEEHFSLIRGTGGSVNAFTSFDFTAYVNTVPSNQLDLALWLEAERMMFLRVDQEGFETERQVVIEERRQDLNEPYGTVFEQIMPVLFTKHPYRWLPIGQIEHLMEAQVDELQTFWNTFYVPNNATLVIVGAVAHEDAQKLAQQYFGWIPALPLAPKVAVQEPPQTETREVLIHEGIGPAPLLRNMYRTVPHNHPDYTALQVLADALGGGQSSRVYVDLVKERQLCQEAFAYLWGLEQDGLLMVGAELLPGGDIDALLPEFEAHIAAVQAEGITQRELEKVQNQLRRREVTDTLTVEKKAQAIGRTVMHFGSPDELNRRLDAIEAVTLDDVRRVANAYMTPERLTKVRVMPKEDYVYTPVAPEGGEFTPYEDTGAKQAVERPESVATEPPLQDLLEGLPEFPLKEKTLPNGLKVVVVPNDEVPFVTVMLGLRKGAWTEPADMPGTASMALSMLTKGTSERTAAELAEYLEFNALTLSGAAESNGAPSMDVGQVMATALSDKFPLALELLAEVVLDPTFPENELAILKNQRKLELEVQRRDPRYIADREIKRRLYGDHPYARSARGEYEHVDNINREALVSWWGKHARPDQAVLLVAGDVSERQVFKLARKHLGDWKAPDTPVEVEYPPLPERAETHIYLVDNPGSVQSQIRVGQLSITRDHPDYHRSRVFTQIFGSGFESRLNKIIRIERGLTYAVWGYIAPNLKSGDFLSSTFTKTESTAETVQALLDVIETMRAIPPSDEELGGARSFLIGSFPKNLETPMDVLAYQWLIEYNGLPQDYLNQAIEGYRETTGEDVVRIAHEVVDPSRLTIVVVGDAEQVRESLEAIAPVTVIPREATVAP